jgi:hypothetical protein
VVRSRSAASQSSSAAAHEAPSIVVDFEAFEAYVPVGTA